MLSVLQKPQPDKIYHILFNRDQSIVNRAIDHRDVNVNSPFRFMTQNSRFIAFLYKNHKIMTKKIITHYQKWRNQS